MQMDLSEDRILVPNPSGTAANMLVIDAEFAELLWSLRE